MLLKVAPGFLVLMLLISLEVQRTNQRGSRLSLACQVVGYVRLQLPRERDNFTEGTEYAFELRCQRVSTLGGVSSRQLSLKVLRLKAKWTEFSIALCFTSDMSGKRKSRAIGFLSGNTSYGR